MKMRAAFRLTLLAILAAAVLSPTPSAQAGNLSATIARVASGLDRPVAVASAGDGSGRLFILERPGRIRLYKSGAIRSTYISIPGKVKCCSFEEGALGLDFHPNFASNGRFYVTYSDNEGDLRLSSFRDPSPSGKYAPEDSEDVILQINHRTYDNHWGGDLQFGSKYLYMSTGDGGGSGDPSNNAQDRSSLLGKVLRLNVDTECHGKEYCVPASNPYYGDTPGREEIFHRGLRNPWKFSFDRATWYMWLADVGEQRYEEVNRANTDRNFGWDCREGTVSFSGCSGSFTNPIHTYSHSSGRCAIIGGFVVRGANSAPALEGWYVYADYCTGEIWALRRRSGGGVTIDKLYNHGRNITSFGQADNGNIYFTSVAGAGDTNGRLYRLDT